MYFEMTLNVSIRMHLKEVELLSRVPAVVIFCNIYDAEEMKLAKVLSICITDLGDDAPPTILVPHVPSSSKRDKKDEFVMLSL